MPVPPHSAPWVSPASTKREDTRRTLFGSLARSRRAKIHLISGRRKTTIAKLSPSLKNSACARSSRIATLVWANCTGGSASCSKQGASHYCDGNDAGDGDGILAGGGGGRVEGIGLMRCPNCQSENREGRRFCSECGASLNLACPSCGFSNEAGEKFCGGCGQPLASPQQVATKFSSPEVYTPKHLAEKILTSKSALEGERKQVTVLFADMKGSMELLADRDPEEARKLFDRCDRADDGSSASVRRHRQSYSGRRHHGAFRRAVGP